ncbi:bromodomain-containing protein, putative [Perkinsus marinus ATCC 50983]|uniref:Bromodomain-containing protein, putative n=1 Tax=Perkinsus marinus (strain ATCC 50983 / TXsc) TaxID=423536 RepID=C5L3U5_PERM5|nr:bromodomain-containing protein, putative [Perkinsus marinus ATCC 50983]EER08674.1 bromodomain-containing protein, putative [Perkinsus marinus ATCC 50983]|eukprot:XP_002776858.1 bromodomain-containing protein, putative [Perkinsus marinus ATCC 50983]
MAILSKAREHNCAAAFLEPVAWEDVPGLQDYPLVVKRPMDLGTISAKVEKEGEDAYDDFGEFEDDLNLIWDNCHLFNQPGSYIYKMATKMRSYCQSLCASCIAARNRKKRKVSHSSEGKQSKSRRSSVTISDKPSRGEAKAEGEYPFATTEVAPPLDKAAVDELHAAKLRLGWRLHSSLSPKELALVVEFMRSRKTTALKPLGPPDQDTGAESLLVDIDYLSALDYGCFTDRKFMRKPLSCYKSQGGGDILFYQGKFEYLVLRLN